MAAPGGAASSRVGLSVGRAVGSAVERNRVKRWIREAVRHGLSGLQGRWDLVIVAKPAARLAGAAGLAREIDRGFAMLGEVGP